MEIRALRKTDARGFFQSGDPDLDRFLRLYAGQNQFRHHIGVTYVAQERGRILGYATVAPGHIEIEDFPLLRKTRLPRYPLPVLRLARLAVDRSVQGRGVGQAMLKFVLHMALEMADKYGCVGVAVDTKPDAVPFYARCGFMALDAVEGQSEARPRATVMFLSIREIREAQGGRDSAEE